MTTTKNNENKKLNFSNEREQSQACLNSAEHEKNQGRKVLNVPNLRFPEFEGEWHLCKISNILSIGNGRDYKHLAKGNIPVFGTGGYMTSVNDYLYDGETTFIGRKGTINKPYYYKGKFWTVDTLFYTHSFDGVTPHFVYCLFQTINWLKYNEASGVPSLSKDTIEKIKVHIPQIKEQQKISRLILLLDERISTQNKIIDKLQSLIKGIMVELQKQGVNKGTWKKVFLSDVLTERNERNTNLFQVFSVSVSQGVVNQVDYLGRSFAAKDTSKYNVVHYGDLVYTKSPTGSFPYGIVKQSLNLENVAVSPLYGVYKPKSLAVGAYLHEYFMSEINTHNYLHPLIQKGAKNTINITNQRFLENCVLLPTNINELLQISKLLRSLNDKLKYLQNTLQKYQKQKQYLLRQMFI